jgi:hypothetical protein
MIIYQKFITEIITCNKENKNKEFILSKKDYNPINTLQHLPLEKVRFSET